MVSQDQTEFDGPMEFVHALGAQLDVAGAIRGGRREIAVLQIRYRKQPLYGVSLTPDMPRQETPYSLVVNGWEVLAEGAVLELTVPTEAEFGSVLLNAELATDQGKQRFRGKVVCWPLASTVD